MTAAWILYDIGSIPAGESLHRYIDQQLSQTACILAVIGPGWIDDVKRLKDPNDFVRIEIASALSRQTIPVIPVLVLGATMPDRTKVPRALLPQLPRNAVTVLYEHFAAVVEGRLTLATRGAFSERVARRAPGPGTEIGGRPHVRVLRNPLSTLCGPSYHRDCATLLAAVRL